MKMNEKQFQQGDILLEVVDSIPEESKIVKQEEGIILAEGEVTGHAHRVRGKAVLLQAPDGTFYLKPEGPAMLEHTKHGTYVPKVNHGPVELKKVTFNVRHVQEYDYLEMQSRQVRD